MNELTLDGKTYVSSKRAAELTGYAKDYVGQLCREGHVEARLVGRNWYVLESSIREHRFGKKEEDATKQENKTPTWEAPRYKPEFPVYIAPITERKEEIPQEITPIVPESPERAALLSDMQSAWQEWFTKKERDEQETPQEEEETVAVPEAAEEVPLELEEESTPVVIHSVHAESAIEEEPEMTSYESQEPLDLTKGYKAEEGVEEFVEPYSEPQKVSAARNLILRSIFVGISVIAVTIAVIGTGFSSRIAGSNTYRLTEINFISGVSVYNK